jgi:hypothetical protein
MTSALANLDPAERTVYRESLRTWVTANNEEVANELTRQWLTRYVHWDITH